MTVSLFTLRHNWSHWGFKWFVFPWGSRALRLTCGHRSLIIRHAGKESDWIENWPTSGVRPDYNFKPESIA